MKISKLLPALFMLFIIASCSKNGDVNPINKGKTDSTKTTPVTNGTITGGKGLYVAGAETFYILAADSTVTTAKVGRVAKIWKDDKVMNLTDGKYDAAATSVFANLTDAYAVGFQLNAAGKKVATLWKNGVATALSSGKTDCTATSVYVTGNDVYVSGTEVTSDSGIAWLWKNGAGSKLAGGIAANSVVVSSAGKVYVSGNDVNEAAMLWTDGKGVVLVNGGRGDANQVVVNGSDVYVCGSFRNNGEIAGYWKNGKWTMLTNEDSEVTSIYAGADLYMIGFITNVPVLWKNGVATAIGYDNNTDPNKTSYFGYVARSITVGSGKYYMAGSKTTSLVGAGNYVHDYTVPTLWTNASVAILDNGDSAAIKKVYGKTGGVANSVYLVE